jgi:hypothetical protein
MTKRDLESIKFEKGDLVRLATDSCTARVSLGIVLEQRAMVVIVKWVVYSLSPRPIARQTIYSLEKVGEEGAK